MCKIMEEIHDDAYHAGWAGGWAGGEAKGLVDGEEKKAKETALKLAARGDSAEGIAELLEYDVDTVKKWIHDGKAVN